MRNLKKNYKVMRILHLNFDDSIGGASRAAIRLHKALLLKKVKSRNNNNKTK